MLPRPPWDTLAAARQGALLLGADAPPEETVVGSVQVYTGGYAHRIWKNDWSALELGARVTLYETSERLLPFYGAHPVGVAGLLHWRVGH